VTIPDEDAVATLVAKLARHGQFAEAFCEDTHLVAAALEGEQVTGLRSATRRGAAFRLERDTAIWFACTADLSGPGLAEAARSIVSSPLSQPPSRMASPPEPGACDELLSSFAAMMDSLRTVREQARAAEPAVSSVRAQARVVRRRVRIVTADGGERTDLTYRTSLSIRTVARHGGKRHGGFAGWARAGTFTALTADDVAGTARLAGQRAGRRLRAAAAPAGRLPVIFAPGGGGILFHEACGHCMEADSVRRGAAAFAGRLGERVADSMVSLVDDGTVPQGWGSSGCDDEGNPTRRTVLVDRGCLRGYLADSYSGRVLGIPAANGRRQNYRCQPASRMTNTFLLPGQDDPAEIVRQTRRGIYCVELGGGSCTVPTGDFTFTATDAFLIENGEITTPLPELTLVGNGPEVLRLIDAVGTDFGTHTGSCGKDGHYVPVSDGNPTVRVQMLTVGGR